MSAAYIAQTCAVCTKVYSPSDRCDREFFNCGQFVTPSSLSKCSGCRSVYYCSREHQREHWKTHKHLCKALKTLAAQESEMRRTGDIDDDKEYAPGVVRTTSGDTREKKGSTHDDSDDHSKDKLDNGAQNTDSAIANGDTNDTNDKSKDREDEHSKHNTDNTSNTSNTSSNTSNNDRQKKGSYHQLWRVTRQRQMLSKILGRELTAHERSFIMFRPHCDYCKRDSVQTEADITTASLSTLSLSPTPSPTPSPPPAVVAASASALTSTSAAVAAGEGRKGGKKAIKKKKPAFVRCKECLVTLFCPDHEEDGKKTHEPHCKTARHYVQCEQVIADFKAKQQDLMWIPTDDPSENFRAQVKKYKKLPSSWNAYYNWREAPIEMYSPLLTLFTTNLSQPLSIVYGLERTYGVAALENMRVLTVDIVGATNSFEAQFPDKYEEILHLLPRLRELHLRFIGPTLRAPAAPASSSSSSSASMHAGNSSSSSSSSGEGHVFTHPLCDDCSGRKYTISFHSSMYHDFLASAASSSSSSPSTAPSLIVAFNSGLHLFEQGSSNDTWDATLRAMLSHNDTPVLLTSYSKEEQILDSARLEAYDANFVMQPTLNPFRSLLPQREPTGLPEQPHYYHNQYIFAVKGTGSASASAAGGSGGRGDGKWTLAAAKIPYIDLIKMSQK